MAKISSYGCTVEKEINTYAFLLDLILFYYGWLLPLYNVWRLMFTLVSVDSLLTFSVNSIFWVI